MFIGTFQTKVTSRTCILLQSTLYYTFIFQSPDGKYIASGAIDGIINIFDVASGKLVHTLEGSTFFYFFKHFFYILLYIYS